MAFRNISRATRLSKHWAHHLIGPQALNADQTILFDLFFNWRATFGISSVGTMTVMRMLGTVHVADLSVTVGEVMFGMIKGSIGAQPSARPGGVTADDFTNWLYWKHFAIFQTPPVTPENVFSDDFDLRGMRKFDPSRETIYMIVQSIGGGVSFANISYGVRMLCGE